MVQFKIDPTDIKRLVRGVRRLASAVRIEVQTDRRGYSPGDVVAARVRILALRDCSINGGAGALVHVWGFEWTQDNHTRHLEYPESAVDTVLTVGGSLRKGEVIERSFTLQLPDKALPSGRGSTVWSRWEVGVKVSLSGADAQGACPIRVFSPPERREGYVPPGNGRCSGCDLSVEAASRMVLPGEVVTGNVAVRAQEALEARRLMLRLERIENVNRLGRMLREESRAVELLLAEPFEDLQPGEERSFTFDIPVPADACPSVKSPEFEIGWRLVAELDRKFRKDDEFELPLRVLSPAPDTNRAGELPVVPPERTATVHPVRSKVKRAWYVLAALSTVGSLAAAGSALILLFGAVYDLQRVVIPGEGTLRLEEQQDYTIFLEWESEVDGERYIFPGDEATTEMSLTGPDGEPVELSEPDSETNYSVGPFWGNSHYEFTSGPAGTYLLEATFASGETEPKLVLAVDLGNFVSEGLVAGFIAFALFLGASAVWFRIFRMRRRIRQSQPAALSGVQPT